MVNEFVIRILLLNLLMCQTNFVPNLSVRSTLAWIFVAIIIKMVALNMGMVIFESVKSLKIYAKRTMIKCKARRSTSLQVGAKLANQASSDASAVNL